MCACLMVHESHQVPGTFCFSDVFDECAMFHAEVFPDSTGRPGGAVDASVTRPTFQPLTYSRLVCCLFLFCLASVDAGVPDDSNCPTFATCVLFVKNRRWSGVPFIFKAGKALNETKAEASIRRSEHTPKSAIVWRHRAKTRPLLKQTQPRNVDVGRLRQSWQQTGF